MSRELIDQIRATLTPVAKVLASPLPWDRTKFGVLVAPGLALSEEGLWIEDGADTADYPSPEQMIGAAMRLLNQQLQGKKNKRTADMAARAARLHAILVLLEGT